MKEDAAVAGHLGRLFHGEDHPRFVVGPHQADDGRIRGQAPPVLLHVQAAFPVDREFRDPISLRLPDAHTAPYGRMFHPAGHDVTLVGLGSQRRADGGVVAFRAATGEDDFLRDGADERRHLFPRFPDFRATCPPKVCMLEGLP